MRKIIVFLFVLLIGYIIYNETTRVKRIKHNNKEVIIDTKNLNNILDSVNNAQDSIAIEIDKLNYSNENHKVKNKKMKDSLDRLNKERKYLITKVKCLEQEKSREMIVQKSVKDTISEK